jgi:O-antigen ligase
MIFSGASWAILSLLVLVKKRRDKLLLVGAAAVVALAQAETGGRAGYVTWGLIGLIVCIFRWRRFLPLLPLLALGICIFLPGVRDRMLQGFVDTPKGEKVDEFVITSGRTVAWSYVIADIWKSPIIGYGRQAMIRIGIWQRILEEQGPGETFPNPHNAYLEVLLDNGFVGFFLAMPFYVVVVWLSFKVFRDWSDPLFCAAGGTALTLVLGLLFSSMGGESFYPKESSLGMWCAIGILLRVCVQRRQSLETGAPLFDEDETEQSELAEEVQYDGSPA